ncbi:unnamed protein product [Oikopleura dioica]|uniref:Uncharacterized protein n=1 Tax=Oikopleura dioica TaxID=34765 RepID=E4WS94_OIKDI|nr:unnamed protein product [Oikopleura dioica]
MTSTPISWAKVAVTKPKPKQKPTPQVIHHFPALAKKSSKPPPGFETVKPSRSESPVPVVTKKKLTKPSSVESGQPKLSDILRREIDAGQTKKKLTTKLKRGIDSSLQALADPKEQKYQTIAYIRGQYKNVKGTSQLKTFVDGLAASKDKELKKIRQLEHEIEAVEQKLKFDKDGSSSIPEFQLLSKEIRLRKRRVDLIYNHTKAATERIETLLDDVNSGNDLFDNINNLIDEFNEEFIFSDHGSADSSNYDSFDSSRSSTPASLNPSAEVFSPTKSRPSTPIMTTAQRYKKWVEDKMGAEWNSMSSPPQPVLPIIPNVPRYCALVSYMPGLWMMQSPVAVNCYKYIILPKSRNVPAVLHTTQPYCTSGQAY